MGSLGNKQGDYFKFIVIALLFLLLAFDRDLAMIYLLIMLGDFIWFMSDGFISFPMSSNKVSNSKIYLESALGLGAFLVISTFLVSFFQPQALLGGITGGAQTIFHLLATTTPILKGSDFLTLLGWGVLVPIIETNFFAGRLLEGFSTYSEKIFKKRISVERLSGNLWMVIFFVSALFTLFHITSKGLESVPLIITFVFMVISCLLVIRHKQTKGAIYMHIVVNSAAVASSIGWI